MVETLANYSDQIIAMRKEELSHQISKGHAVAMVFVRHIEGVPHVLMAERPGIDEPEITLPAGKADKQDTIYNVAKTESRQEIGMPEKILDALVEDGHLVDMGNIKFGIDRRGVQRIVTALLVNYPPEGPEVFEPYAATDPATGEKELTTCYWKPLHQAIADIHERRDRLEQNNGSSIQIQSLSVTSLALQSARVTLGAVPFLPHR